MHACSIWDAWGAYRITMHGRTWPCLELVLLSVVRGTFASIRNFGGCSHLQQSAIRFTGSGHPRFASLAASIYACTQSTVNMSYINTCGAPDNLGSWNGTPAALESTSTTLASIRRQLHRKMSACQQMPEGTAHRYSEACIRLLAICNLSYKIYIVIAVYIPSRPVYHTCPHASG